MSREPEVIRAFRDTWKNGIHSYLNYLRDRLMSAHELLHATGSIFVQIGEENLHIVRSLLDEIFLPQNAVATLIFLKTGGATSEYVPGVYDALIWYAKDKARLKYKQLYRMKEIGGIRRHLLTAGLRYPMEAGARYAVTRKKIVR